jgi:hypothetical protein
MARAVFDCVIYDGEIDALAIRLHELDAVVDWFVIVESTLTFSGLPRAISFDPGDPRISHFAGRFRHVVVADMPETDDPWQREIWQRNAVLRGLPDAASDDLLILSDVDEVPRATVVSEMRDDLDTPVFGLELGFFYFFVDYKNVEGPEAAITWTVAARRSALNDMSPNDLRYAVRDRRAPARIIANAGWHFSYLMDEARVRRKIAAFSHQEFNNPAFLEQIDISALVQRQGDFFGRPGFVWAFIDSADLPAWLQANKETLRHLFAPGGPAPTPPVLQLLPPVVICPYLLDQERDEIRAKFALDSEQGAAIPFFLWQDNERIGPEHAFERCWEGFPDRDIIIIHSDMAPFPGDAPTLWYDQLCEYRSLRPDAGMIAANLFYPPEGPDEPLRVQCAGGTFRDETIGYLYGDVDCVGGVSQSLLEAVRPVDWVTFGGVLIRREVIKACGGFDNRYQWAYYMDCDYCFEARLRGFRLLQVPVRLLHEESRSTRSLTAVNPELALHIEQNKELFSEKWQPFLPALPSEEGLEVSDITTRHNVAKITLLDTAIFSIQPEHNLDRVSFLRIQKLVREIRPGYTYLEVGSDIGGSLLPHLLDPCCAAAVSIDPRPHEQPDERGVDFQYVGNSTERMLGELGQHVRPHELGKLSTIEQDISVVDRSCLTIRPQLVLIDAEHTNVAAFSDFMGVLPLIADDALVTFHDANLVGDAIQMIERFLQHARTPYSLTILPSCVAVFGFGTFVRSMEAALRPYAEPAAAYFAAARQQRHRSVADAVISQTQGLPGRSIAELVAATNTANARIAELVAATNAAKAEIVELVAATNTANTEIATLQMALDQAEAAHARDQALIDALQTSINSLTASTSWRVTAPLRAAADLMRGRGA